MNRNLSYQPPRKNVLLMTMLIAMLATAAHGSWSSFGSLRQRFTPIQTAYAQYLQPRLQQARTVIGNNRWAQLGLAAAGTAAFAYGARHILHSYTSPRQYPFVTPPQQSSIVTPRRVTLADKEFIASLLYRPYNLVYASTVAPQQPHSKASASATPEPIPFTPLPIEIFTPDELTQEQQARELATITARSEETREQEIKRLHNGINTLNTAPQHDTHDIIIVSHDDPRYIPHLQHPQDQASISESTHNRLTRITSIKNALQKTPCQACSTSLPIKTDGQKELKLSACQSVRQEIVNFTTRYSQELGRAQTEPKFALPEAFSVYKNFCTLAKKDDSFAPYARAYNRGLRLVQNIHRDEKITTAHDKNIINIMTYFYIKAVMLRESPIDESTFVIVNGDKLADYLFTQSELMQGGQKATHFSIYPNMNHYRLKTALALPTHKEELLGGRLPDTENPAQNRFYIKLELHGVNGLLSFIQHGAGVPLSQTRRRPVLRQNLNTLIETTNAFTGLNLEPIRSNDHALYAKEHNVEEFNNNYATITHMEPQTDSQSNITQSGRLGLQGMLPVYHTIVKESAGCHKECAALMITTIEKLFSPPEAALLYAKHGMEVTFDMNEVVKDTPLQIPEQETTILTEPSTLGSFELV